MDHKIDKYIASDIGGRAENQDFAAHKETKLGRLFLVCDGMGGTKGGAIASELAVDVILTYFDRVTGFEEPLECLRAAITQANKVIFEKSISNSDLRGMGTTVAALLIREHQKKFYTSHVGDSRVYHIRHGRLRFRTKDHSVVQGKVDRGEISEKEARFDPHSNQITRALGVKDSVEIDQSTFEYTPLDVFLLTSDGIHGEIDESEILKIVSSGKNATNLAENIKVTCMTNGAVSKAGKHDNLTIVAVVADPQIWSANPRNRIRIAAVVVTLVIIGITSWFLRTSSPSDPPAQADISEIKGYLMGVLPTVTSYCEKLKAHRDTFDPVKELASYKQVNQDYIDLFNKEGEEFSRFYNVDPVNCTIKYDDEKAKLLITQNDVKWKSDFQETLTKTEFALKRGSKNK